MDWIRGIDVSVPRPIAEGVIKPGRACSREEFRYRPELSRELNEYQADAIVRALDSRLTFIWGPPGTGKSRTISELITQYLIAGKSVLFLSVSNLAVDIVSKQVIRNENPTIQQLKARHLLLRTGYPRMQPVEQWQGVLPYEIALEETPELKRQLDKLKTERKRLIQKSRQGENVAGQLKSNRERMELVRAAVREKVYELEIKARFIATTLAKASVTQSIKGRRFDAVVIDEVSMMNVPAVFAALTLATQHGVVAGDFRQLQPILVSSHAKAIRWLGHSVFVSSGIRDAVMKGHCDDPRLVVLRRQYRIADEISAMVNAMFYGGILENAQPEARRLIPVSQLWERSRLVLVDVSGLRTVCEKDVHSHSRVNRQMAAVSSDLARQYMDMGVSVGIVTPYRAQAKEIRKNFTREELRDQVQVATVHKFQGSERDVIIFEVADSRPVKPSRLITGSKDTFLDPEPKSISSTLPLVNVALTRAKSQVILVGDLNYIQDYLSKANILRIAAKHFVEMGTVVNRLTGEVTRQRRPTRAATTPSARGTDAESAAAFDQSKARKHLQCTCGGNLVVRQNRYGGYF